jgi:predicted DNA-binding transcriptional regulator YafY
MYRHGLYAIGARLDTADDDVRTAPLVVFAIERFTMAEYVRSSHFEIPVEARVRETLEGSFGPHLPDATGPHDVIVAFSKAKAHLVSSRVWHPTQTIITLPDGRIRLAFRVPSIAPIVSWLLEWGPHARAVAPTVLVEDVKRELDSARALYSD